MIGSRALDQGDKSVIAGIRLVLDVHEFNPF